MSCPDCLRGGVSTSHPTGEEATVHGLQTYIARPDNGLAPKGVVVFITDAFGWKFVNNRVLSDHYAKKGGFLVYLPDFMDGHAMDPQANVLLEKIMEESSLFTKLVYKPVWIFQAICIAIPWKMKTGIPITSPRVISFVQALRTSEPPFPTDNLKIGAAGFCWGGKHAIILAQDDPATRVVRHQSQIQSETSEKLIDCAFTAHPSYLEVPTDIEPITVPTSVAVGDDDMVLKGPEAKQMKEIFDTRKSTDYEVAIMPGAKHGFAVRTHPDDKHEMECAQKAEDQALAWFTRWLA
ncbi:Alpha/Beta hydrolase protein [Amylocarpus encephaloides]|uniref:Alpha/Beta hydrolase protein n=1 Tax=Amylocarpus encephaloides TaxID=45428 RepID=A0A9P8C2J0_9HELO|nr:Alpha/Beta hydrolase protein [Amylocarpus encephaloides]